MFKNITIDSVLKEYYYAIDSDKLNENNISIDENLEVEDSYEKYVRLFAAFLNEAYFKGYVISEPIFKRLMNIIEYEGFEYQIMEAYANILDTVMIDHNWINNRPEYRVKILDLNDSIKFINQYLETIQQEDFTLEKAKKSLPRYYDNDSEYIADEEYVFKLLQEVEYPISVMYNDIIKNSHGIDKFVKVLYIICKNNIDAYKDILHRSNYNMNHMWFLLDSLDNKELDILVNNIRSVHELAELIKTYSSWTNILLNGTSEPDYKLSRIATVNVERLFELVTINVTIEQTALLMDQDLDTWISYCRNNDYNLKTIAIALNMRLDNEEKYKILDQLSYLYKLKDYYRTNTEFYSISDDIAFYARHALLNMDYSMFCENFVDIYDYLLDQIMPEQLHDIILECLTGLSNLNNKVVNNALVDLSKRLHDDKTMNKYSKYIHTLVITEEDKTTE